MKATVLTIYMLMSISAELGVLTARPERVVAQVTKTRPRKVMTTKPASRAPAKRKSAAKPTAGRAKNITRARAGGIPRKSGAKTAAGHARQITRARPGDMPRKSAAKPTARRAVPEIEMVLVPGGSFLMGSPE